MNLSRMCYPLSVQKYPITVTESVPIFHIGIVRPDFVTMIPILPNKLECHCELIIKKIFLY